MKFLDTGLGEFGSGLRMGPIWPFNDNAFKLSLENFLTYLHAYISENLNARL